jgi:hypothetical protein
MSVTEPVEIEKSRQRTSLTTDLFLPVLLFGALGGMTWAVRGCSGFGSVLGCVFAGLTWGVAWWYIAQVPEPEQTRRYASGWIVAALTFGIGVSGARGWMQWPSFFRGELMTDAPAGQFVPISPAYGFLWLFIAGVPWAGLGACLMAWSGSLRETRAWHWAIRIACGVGGGLLLRFLFDHFPEYFLPLYTSLEERYRDAKVEHTDPNLLRLINDCGSALTHLGFYLGFLAYEAVRKEGKNVVLILTVGIVNGIGWALCQNWSWAHKLWPDGHFNWWRCWESSGGISMGVAYGLAYFLVNRPMSARERATLETVRPSAAPTLEWLLVYLGLASFLSLLLQHHMGELGPVFFAAAMLTGTAYYLTHREAAGSTPAANTGIFIITAILNVALIAGLFQQQIVRGFRPRGLDFQTRSIYFASVMGLAFVAYLALKRSFNEEEQSTRDSAPDLNIERLGLSLGLIGGLSISIVNGLKGWFNIYKGHEDYWRDVLWRLFGPVFLFALIAVAIRMLFFALPKRYRGPHFPMAYGVLWSVLVIQYAIAFLVTGPLTDWVEAAFAIYYLLLFFITSVIVIHYHSLKQPYLARSGALSDLPVGPTAIAVGPAGDRG